jgi:hypothetical protein
MILENMNCNLKNEKMCRDNTHGTLVFLAFAQIESAATSRSPGALLSIPLVSIFLVSIGRVVMALPRASTVTPLFGRVG